MAKNWQETLRWIAWQIYLSVLGLLILLLFLVSLIFFIPTFIWRPIAKALAPYLRPDLAKMMSCTSSVFAQVDDDNYSKSVMVMQATFKGVVEYETLLKRFQEQVINCKDEQNNLRYPQLQQFITNWAGYKFWKWEQDFNLRHHVHVVKHANLSKTPEDLRVIGQDLMCGTFSPRLSPWDFTLVPGVQIDGQLSTLFYFRAHHALADGYSLLFMSQRLFGDVAPHAPHSPRHIPLTPGYFLRLPVKVLSLVGELAHNTVTTTLWKIPEEEKSAKWSYSVGKAIPISTILQIKRHFGVSFTSVVFSLVTGGLRQFIAKNKSATEIMASLPALFSIPVKSHPDVLCNKFSFAMTSYPVGTSDPVERLEIMNQNFESLRDSPAPILGYLFLHIYGSHFNFVGKFLNSYRYAPLLATYFPIGSPSWSLQNCPVIKTCFYLRLQQGQQGAMFCISTFHEALHVTPVFNGSLLSVPEVAELCQYIETEAQILFDATKVREKKVM